MIQDSGERKEFNTGAVRDMSGGKGRFDLIPLDIISRITGYEALEYINSFKKNKEVKDLYSAIYCIENDDNTIETIMLEVAVHFEEGAKKYGEFNWQKGIPLSSYINSMVRHLLKFYRGDNDERHDRAFVWNVICCIWTFENKPELNDL